MDKRKFTFSILTMAVALLFGAGVIALAAGVGSADDPFVTLSYITDVAVPQANAKIDSVIAAEKSKITADIESKYSALKAEIEGKIGSGAQLSQATIDQIVNTVAAKVGVSSGSGAAWSEVSLAAGATLVLDAGADAILRVGTATCYGASGTGLINLSSGETLSSGKNADANNMYNAPAAGRGFTATKNATFIIRGGYTKK